jgi:hypothetical protein
MSLLPVVELSISSILKHKGQKFINILNLWDYKRKTILSTLHEVILSINHENIINHLLNEFWILLYSFKQNSMSISLYLVLFLFNRIFLSFVEIILETSNLLFSILKIFPCGRIINSEVKDYNKYGSHFYSICNLITK